ncbi:response regulator, partial [Thiolapillus sp.]
MGKLLKDQGLEVEMAASGEEALDKIATEAIDIVFMDQSMPGMGGIAATTAITSNEKTAHIPVVLCTGNRREQTGTDGRGSRRYRRPDQAAPGRQAKGRSCHHQHGNRHRGNTRGRSSARRSGCSPGNRHGCHQGHHNDRSGDTAEIRSRQRHRRRKEHGAEACRAGKVRRGEAAADSRQPEKDGRPCDFPGQRTDRHGYG